MRNNRIVSLFAITCLISTEYGSAQSPIIVGRLGNQHGVYGQVVGPLERGDYQEARIDLEVRLAIHPTDARLHALLGDVYVRLEDYERAMDAYSEAIRLGLRQAAPYNSRGALYVKRGDWDRALADINEAIRIEPNSPEYYFNRALAYAGERQNAKARADFEHACELSHETLQGALSGLANLLATCPEAEIRDGHRAVEYARKACEQTGANDYFAVAALAAAHAESGQWDEAVRRAEQALELAQGRYRRFERICLELYRYREPFREYPPETVAKRRAATAGEALLYAIVKKRAGNSKGAVADLRKAIELNPMFAEAHLMLGELILADKRDPIEAATEFTRCLELNPKHSEALGCRATAEVWLGKFREALADADAALSLDPNDSLALVVRPWALASLGEVDRALQELNELSQGLTDLAFLHALQGHCYAMQGRLEDAVSELTKAIRRYPSDVLAYADRAVALTALGKEEEAKRDLQEVTHLAPSMRDQTEARMKAAKNNEKR